MRRELLDEAVREFIAAQDSATVYQAAVTRIAQFLDCDACYIVAIVDGAPIPRAASDDERDYETTSASFTRGVASEASARNTVSVINDLTFTRSGTTGRSTGDSKRQPEMENAESPAAADGIRATESGSKRHSGADLRSLLTVPIGEYGVVQAMDRNVGAFTEGDVEWIERLLSFAHPALARLRATTSPHLEAGQNGVPVADSDATDGSNAELAFTVDRQSTSSSAVESPSTTGADPEQIVNLVSGLTHDLKNPLSIANGRLDLALEKVAADEAASEEFEHVMTALDRIEHLVKEFETLQKGELVVDREPIDLKHLAREYWELVPTSEATLQVDGSLQFEADPDAFSRLLENLFRNAVDHGGSEVTVRVGPCEADGIYIEDDGVGIPEGERQRVFELGYSLDDTGAGLGLAIVKQIIEEHGWEVSVTEADNGGARFEITGVETVQ